MRQWRLVAMTAALAGLAGCGATSTTSTTTSDNGLIVSQLAGTWKQTDVSTDGGTTYTSSQGPTLAFNSVGTFSDGAAGDTGSWNYTANKQILTLSFISGTVVVATAYYNVQFAGSGVMVLVTNTTALKPTANTSKWSRS